MLLELGSDPITQLSAMARCDHAIIANSSFAWWGAWLGDQLASGPHRTVVAPEEYGVPDRFPSRWLTVPSGTPVM